MSRDKGARLVLPSMGGGMGGGESRGGVNKSSGKAAEKRNIPGKIHENREPEFTIWECFNPLRWSEVKKTSSRHIIPTVFARKLGKNATNGEVIHSSYTTREKKGWWHLGLGTAGLLMSVVGTVKLVSSEDSVATRPGSSAPTSTAASETSLPSVIVDGSGFSTTTVTDTISGTTVNTSLNSIPSTVVPAGEVMSLGMQGPSVATLQSVLASIGCNIGPSGTDGQFGASTESAVIAFQKNAKLEADGLVGPATQMDLATAVALGNVSCGVGV